MGRSSGSVFTNVSGSIRLSYPKSWLITGEGVEFGQQPFGLALRFFSDRLAVDLGVILVGNALSSGFPIPWFSFAFHFGP